MKKIVAFLFFLVLAVAFSSNSVFAGGDQVIGNKAVGPANQYGECPFTGPSY